MRLFSAILDELKEEMVEMEFPHIIREARERLGISQVRLSKLIGVTYNRIKNLELGHFRTIPRMKEMKGLSDAYGIEVNFLKSKAVSFLKKKLQGKTPKNGDDF